MIKHIVMWNLRGDTPDRTAEAAALVKRVLEALDGKVPGLRHIEVGVDSSRVDYACDVVLYSEFDSQQPSTPMPSILNTCAPKRCSAICGSPATRWITSFNTVR